jgi:deazaflavin-dependent oxidoreductase (nitroreductase family)
MGNRITNTPDPAIRPAPDQERAEGSPAASSTRPLAGQSRPVPRADTLALQGAANRVVRGLLRTPLLCRVVGNWLLTIYLVGRKSGRRYAVPVAYVRHDGCLVAGTQFGWGRNLRTGEPVQIRLKGKRRTADVQVITDEAGVVQNYAIMARGNHQFAKFNKIGFDQAGNPDPTDLRLAWTAGARAFRLTPR